MTEPTAFEQMLAEDIANGVDVHAYWRERSLTPEEPEEPPWRAPAPPWSPNYVPEPATGTYDPPAPGVLARDDEDVS